MQIELAQASRIDEILEVYDSARAYMRENGNPHQWTGGYPSRELLLEDIARGQLYLCTEESEIYGVFCYFEGEDPTYLEIFDGAWCNDRPYGVIHRIAVARHCRGVASFCFSHCFPCKGHLQRTDLSVAESFILLTEIPASPSSALNDAVQEKISIDLKGVLCYNKL